KRTVAVSGSYLSLLPECKSRSTKTSWAQSFVLSSLRPLGYAASLAKNVLHPRRIANTSRSPKAEEEDMSFNLQSLDPVIHIAVRQACGLLFSIVLILGGVFQRRENWFIDYYYRGRRQREKVGPSKGQAIQALSVRESEIAQGKFKLLPKRGALTFEDLTEK